MLSRNLQPQGASGPSWTVVQASAAPLALEAFPGLTRALCTQTDNAHCVPRSSAPHISPFCKSARCLSSEAVWGQAPPLDWVDEALLLWHWWKIVSVDVTHLRGRCGCWDKGSLFASGVVFRAACVCSSRGGSSLSSVFNRSRIRVFPPVLFLPFDKCELMPEARR